jgi:hypothetical protein
MLQRMPGAENASARNAGHCPVASRRDRIKDAAEIKKEANGSATARGNRVLNVVWAAGS